MIFPHFRQDLENALRFELGEVGVMILRNQFPMNTIKRGERVDKVPGLITMLLAKNRSDIQFKSSWIETTKEVDIADPEKEYDVITAEGEMNLRAAIVKIKLSIFNSISEHGLQEGSSVKKDFDKLGGGRQAIKTVQAELDEDGAERPDRTHQGGDGE